MLVSESYHRAMRSAPASHSATDGQTDRPVDVPVDTPADWAKTLRWAGVVGFPLLAALTSQTQFWPWLAVPLPPFGVLQTLQSLWVVLAALCIGPRFGTLAFLGYVLVGVLGVPVFADGHFGLATLAGQSGGYIIGFVVCQPVVAWIVRKPDGSIRGWLALIVASLCAHLVIFAIGVPWLWVVHQIDGGAMSFGDAVMGGLVPFVPGMLIKTAIAVMIGRAVVPYAARNLW